MSAGPATPLVLPQPLRGRGPEVTAVERPPLAFRPLDPAVLRLVTFAALAAYAAANWLTLVADPPRGRAALAVLTLTAGAAALVWLGRRVSGIAAWGGALAVAIAATALAGLAIGLPSRLLAPGNWDELANQLGSGLKALGGLTYPYRGSAEWSRLVILLGLPLGIGLAATLAFWPARRAPPLLRMMALVLVVTIYAVGVTVSAPGAPLLRGLLLLLLVAAWLWLPGMGGREALGATALVATAGALALPVTGQLDGKHPWLDYREWDWSWSTPSGGESFDWNHSYGPLDWTRTGETLFEVKSDAPHYWRTVALDQFDGYRWHRPTASGNAAVELPRSPGSSSLNPGTGQLKREWLHSLTFTIRGLNTELVVGAGTPLGVRGLDTVAATQGGLALLSGQSIDEGDTYALEAYIPDPSADLMRRAPRAYPDALAPYTVVALPPSSDPGSPEESSPPSTAGTSNRLTVPFWGAPGAGRANEILSRSVYRGVWSLADRVTAGARTPYDAVQAVESFLRSSSYTYSEVPPERELPLRAFLLRDRTGYCQQFSGAMALMLRMVGVPARVASGFSPGTSSQAGTYTVRDFDAHSWVEAYFNGIGWVPFDPTPAAAPARSQVIGLGAHSARLLPSGTQLPAPAGDRLDLRRDGQSTRGSSASLTWLVPVAVGLLALAGVATIAARVLRNRSVPPGELTDALLHELDSALARLRSGIGGGTTLRVLERRLGVVAGPASSGYAAKLRAARYAPGPRQPPTPAERRALRRELAAGLGPRARLRGLLAIPPGGPVALRRG